MSEAEPGPDVVSDSRGTVEEDVDKTLVVSLPVLEMETTELADPETGADEDCDELEVV